MGLESITYTTLCLFSAAPAIFAYMLEMFRECFTHSRNWSAKGDHLNKMCTEKVQLYEHNFTAA